MLILFELDDYQLLPLTCKQVLWHYRNDFDIFLFGENDHLFKEHHIDKYLEYTSILPENRIAGLIQYEEKILKFSDVFLCIRFTPFELSTKGK